MTNTYDSIGQLQSARGSGGYSTENLGYLYDTAWNLNKRTNNGTPTTFTVDGKNQLTSAAGSSCVYDNNGNLTSRLSGGAGVYYTYDDENQLASVATDTSGTPTGSRWRYTFTYDGRGRLRKRVDYYWNTYPPGSWQVTGETRYVYDGMRVIQERSSANTPTVAYTRGNDLSGSMQGAGGIGGLLARSHGYSGGAFSTHNCYHADGNGNVTYLVNSAEARAAEYRYDPYGNLRYAYDPLPSGGNRYRFSSKEQIPNSGLCYYGYRFYDPNLQRWLNRDPIGELGGVNLYALCQNSPVDYADTNGRYRFGWSLLAGFTTRLAVDFTQDWNKARCSQTGSCRACCNLTAAALATSCAAMGVAGGLVTGGLVGSIPVIGVVAGPIAGVISGGGIAAECLRDVSIGRMKCLQGCPCED